MIELVLGVIEIPYDNGGIRAPKKAPKHPERKPGMKKRKGPSEGTAEATGEPTTTLIVARILEAKYGVMAAFVEQVKPDLEKAIAHSLQGAIEDVIQGAPIGDPYAEACGEVDKAFDVFISTGVIETMGLDGVPTEASLKRLSSRFKRGKTDGPRPSFYDTGAYIASFRSWVE